MKTNVHTVGVYLGQRVHRTACVDGDVADNSVYTESVCFVLIGETNRPGLSGIR